MGNGIAQVFAATGSEVLLIDLDAAALDRGVGAIEKSLGRMVKKEKISQADAETILGRVGRATSLAEATEQDLIVEAVVEAVDRTGPEMEAMMAASTAALTIYDMCKAIDRGMEVLDLVLVEKRGGKSGHWQREA